MHALTYGIKHRRLLRIQVSASSKKRRGLTFGLPQGLGISPKSFGSEKIIVVGPHKFYILGECNAYSYDQSKSEK